MGFGEQIDESSVSDHVDVPAYNPHLDLLRLVGEMKGDLAGAIFLAFTIKFAVRDQMQDMRPAVHLIYFLTETLPGHGRGNLVDNYFDFLLRHGLPIFIKLIFNMSFDHG